MTTVAKAFLRYLVRRRSLSALQLLGIAVGVASAVGMALSARAALSSFSRAVEFLRGAATHSLARPAGPLDERALSRLMTDPAVRAFSPALDRRLALSGGEVVRVLGVDPFLDRRFHPGLAPAQRTGLEFLLEPRAVLVDASLADRKGLRPGGDISTDRGSLRVLGTFPNPSGEPVLLMDIGHAQELFGARGLVDRVDLILLAPEDFRARWEPGFRVESVREREATMEHLLRAFRLNLEALSLLGLFVGVFLVYNTAVFAVVSRRKDVGILLSLGAERAEVAAAFAVELLLLGGLGGLLGSALGFLLSRVLTVLVGGAISNLYFFLRPTPPEWSWGVAVVGVLLGWGASLLGGAFPLRDLVRTEPVEALRGRVYHRGSAARARVAAFAGLGLAVASVLLFLPSFLHVYAGFAGAFGLLVAASLVSGVAVRALGPAVERVWSAAAGLPGKVAAGNLRRNLGRTAVAVAAFMVALSMSIGLGLMIGSFRRTLVQWMDSQIVGDLYIASAAETQVPVDFCEELLRVPGIGGIDAYRNVLISYREEPIYLTAVDARVLYEFGRFTWVQGDRRSWEEVGRGAVIVSESFSRRFGVRRGDRITLEGVGGPAALTVAGVFFDYTTEHGLVMVDRSTYLRIYEDRTIDSLGVFLVPGRAENPRLIDEVRERAGRWNLPVSTREELHEHILAVFDSTFAVTRSMRILAVVVAFFGIAGALLTLYMERQREYGIYRALGFSTVQVALMTLLEGLGMGAISLILSLGMGTVLSIVLIRVINLRSFNWTIFFYPEGSPYWMAAITAASASVGAAAYPIWKVCRTFPHMQIREE